MLPYEDHIRVSRETGATQDPVTGLMTPGATETLLSSPADVQDDRFEVTLNDRGDKHLKAGARVYLPHAIPETLKPGDRAETRQGSVTRYGLIHEIDRFNDALRITWRS